MMTIDPSNAAISGNAPLASQRLNPFERILSAERHAETEESDPERRRPHPQTPGISLVLIGVGLLLLALVGFRLLSGRLTTISNAQLLVVLSAGVGVVAILLDSIRLHLAGASLRQHVTRLDLGLLDVEHKLFQSQARCIDLETQLLSAASAELDESAVCRAEMQSMRGRRAAIRMLVRGADKMAAMLASALRTLARHPKSTAAKTSARDSLLAVRACMETVDVLVDSADFCELAFVLPGFCARLLRHCDRPDLNAAVWAAAQDLLNQANEFDSAWIAGNERVLIDQWLDGSRSTAGAPPPPRRRRRNPRVAGARQEILIEKEF
jgi:hypothetical protein